MKIGIIGAGRLGLTFALLCEKAGYNVLVSDKREDYVQNDAASFQNFVNKFSSATRNYAKRQLLWYRKDSEFLWLEMTRPGPALKNPQVL